MLWILLGAYALYLGGHVGTLSPLRGFLLALVGMLTVQVPLYRAQRKIDTLEETHDL